MRIAVGSTNPVKLESVREAAAQIFEKEAIEVIAVAAESGVPAQPIGDAETMAGASQRAREALAGLPGAEIGIGLEAGIDEIDGRLFTLSWCAAVDGAGRIQYACTPRWELPAGGGAPARGREPERHGALSAGPGSGAGGAAGVGGAGVGGMNAECGSQKDGWGNQPVSGCARR